MTEQILGILSRLLENDTEHSTQKLQVLPVLRLLGVMLCILLCALSRNAVFVVAVTAVHLMRAAILPLRRMKAVLRICILPTLLSCLILLPAVFMGHPSTMLTVALKVLQSTLAIGLLNDALSWKDITGAFSSLHVPDLFILTLDMSVRSLAILGRLCKSMGEALALRTVDAGSAGHRAPGPSGHRFTLRESLRRTARDRTRRTAAGGILGTVFLRSGILAARTGEAMSCRCFDGKYRLYRRGRFSFRDFLYIIALLLMTALFVVTQRAALTM